MFNESWFWIFNLAITLLLILDLSLFHGTKKHEISVREALCMSGCWILIALLFNIGVYYVRGAEDALNFLTGYLVEKSLSVDNLFVFYLIFTHFQVPTSYLHKVLFWGIFGAIVLRALFLLGGIALIQHFHQVIYLFGVFLLIAGIKLVFKKEKEIEPGSLLIVRGFKKIFPVIPRFCGDKFFVKQEGKHFATLLFLVLITIESTDLLFAMDSIPAIIGITEDPFIVYTSNILAILGLRSLYFALSHMIPLFHYLHYGLALILIFIGVKILLSAYITIPIFLSLSIIISILLVSILLSKIRVNIFF
jgi:tellurite resistance protein TerC